MNKIFPISQDPACLLKWGWSTVFFNSGTTSSCHRTRKYAIDPGRFDQFHNLEEKIQEREIMLKGQWPGNGCEYCKKIEDMGQFSDRLMQLSMQQDPGLTAPELFENPQATSVTPTMLEVYFTNTCNMKCIYCGPHFSSQWEDENRRYGHDFDIGHNQFSVARFQENIHYQQMVEDFWRYLSDKKRYSSLRRFHVLGGEPFLLAELDQCLDFWHNHPNPDLVFAVISNLNIPHKRFLSYMQRFEDLVVQGKVWKFQITASIDAWGPQQEYTRFGIDLSLWEKNFEYLLDKSWANLSINSAISALTVQQMPELIGRINAWNSRTVEPIVHSFNTSGNYDDLYWFGGKFFQNDFEKILLCMPNEHEVQVNQKKMLDGIFNSVLKKPLRADKIENLKIYLDQLDRRRNTNWRKIFPWLDQDFSVYSQT